MNPAKIGDNVTIGAGLIVTKSVPDGEVWGGNPARKICKVDEYIERNLCIILTQNI